MSSTLGGMGAAVVAIKLPGRQAEQKATVLCPEDTPDINIREIQQQGASVWKINGPINDCGRIVDEGRDADGWFDMSTLEEAYRIEGKKPWVWSWRNNWDSTGQGEDRPGGPDLQPAPFGSAGMSGHGWFPMKITRWYLKK